MRACVSGQCSPIAYFIRLQRLAVRGRIKKMTCPTIFLCRVKQHLAFNFFILPKIARFSIIVKMNVFMICIFLDLIAQFYFRLPLTDRYFESRDRLYKSSFMIKTIYG